VRINIYCLFDTIAYTLKPDAKSYVSEDPVKLNDRVIRTLQTVVQKRVQATALRECLGQIHRGRNRARTDTHRNRSGESA